jgi:phosphoglycolate phosphatase
LKKGIIFDLDGTLLDSLEDLHRCTNYILRQFGCPERSMQEIRQFVGSGARQLIRLALPGKDDDPELDVVFEAYQTYYNATCNEGSTHAYPGILEALAAIREKYPVAVVSNKPDEAVRALCRDFFGDIYALGVTPDCPRKPHRAMVDKAMEAIGVDACVYVGDSEVDVETAKNAGVPCLSVLWGFRDKEILEQVGAKHFCNSAEELLPMLEKMMEAD